MAAPTAIPHAENSSHSHSAAASHPRSNSPPLLSPPVYSRTAFSLPGGPIVSPSTSSSFRNTANGWAATGVGSGSSSPPGGAQRDKFPERRPSNANASNNNNTPSLGRHSRAFSTSSATSTSGNSLSSSVGSIDSFVGPQTPRQHNNNSNSNDTGSIAASLGGGAPLGRVPSIPLATSPYEAIKSGRRDSWATPITTSPPQQTTWGGFSTLRSGRSPPSHQESLGNDLFRTKSRDSAQLQSATSDSSSSSGGMTGLFRKLSMGTAANKPAAPQQHSHSHHGRHTHGHHGHRSASISAVETPTITTTTTTASSSATAPASAAPADTPPSPSRGRQASLSAGSTTGTRRRPSPHGERLLMGWTHAH
ncbi:unnamed protein product [Sympodiomycopsis kandeliae]